MEFSREKVLGPLVELASGSFTVFGFQCTLLIHHAQDFNSSVFLLRGRIDNLKICWKIVFCLFCLFFF